MKLLGVIGFALFVFVGSFAVARHYYEGQNSAGDQRALAHWQLGGNLWTGSVYSEAQVSQYSLIWAGGAAALVLLVGAMSGDKKPNV